MRCRLAPRRPLPRTLAALIAACLCATAAHALESVRDREIAECRPGDIVTWGDGVDRPARAAELVFAYDHAGAPAWFSAATVTDFIARSATAWSQCGIPARMVPSSGGMEKHPGLMIVNWSEKDSAGNFGLADFGRSRLALGAKAFELLRKANPAHDASQTLQMVISHEMGHLFGLMAHSRRCVDVLSYYHNGKGGKCVSREDIRHAGVVEYRHSLPTACDIARCRRANSLPPSR